MSNFKYRFTLFTPCYNSARFFDRLTNSVANQTFRDFEWIVVNDNSSDETLDLLQSYIKNVTFPVKLINNTTNMMLAANYNLAVEQSEGEYFVTLDHDDEYSPRYLELMDELINKYDNPKVAGVVARCQTQFGKITPSPEYSRPLMNWFEYGHDKSGRSTGEVPRIFKTLILRRYVPFDEKLVHNPLIEARMSLDGYCFITTNEVIRKYYVEETFHRSISNSKSDRLTYYRWDFLRNNINLYSPNYHMSVREIIWTCILYGHASIRYGLSLKETLDDICRWKAIVFMFYPIPWLKSRFTTIFSKFMNSR